MKLPKLPERMMNRNGTYTWRCKENGRQRWISLGKDIEYALAKYHDLEIRRLEGRLPPPDVTVRRAAREWLDLEVAESRSNAGDRQTVKGRVNLYLLPFLGRKRLRDLRAADLRRYRKWLEREHRGKQLAPQTVRNIQTEHRRFFNWCVDEAGYLDRSPVPRRGWLIRLQEKPIRPYSDREVGRLCGLPCWHGFICCLGIATGLRRREMVQARIEDVDFNNGVLTVHKTKSRKIRRIAMPPDILTELHGRVGRILPYSYHGLGSVMRDIKRLAEIEDFTFHRLRHTFGWRFLERTRDLVALQQALGHGSIDMTQRYARLLDETVHDQMRKYHECYKDGVALGVAVARDRGPGLR